MRNNFKLLVYLAAGVGVFTILKRYGILNDIGRWLTDQVPEDYKRQAAHAYSDARQRVNDAGGYVRDQAGRVSDQVKNRVQEVRGGGSGGSQQEQSQHAGNSAGHPGQNIEGKVEETTNPDGSSAVHHVGRGVIR
jgi:hypothetical protein